MLRYIARNLTRIQALMADQSSLPSPTKNNSTPISSFLGSPRFLSGILSRSSSDAETIMSPTSILDGKSLSSFGNPFGFDSRIFPKPPNNKSLEKRHSFDKLDSEAIGLALIDALISDDKSEGNSSKVDSRMVLFGAQLKVQIPNLPASTAFSPVNSPRSPGDFGIRTRNLQLSGSSSAFAYDVKPKESPRTSNGILSLSEMELSEDYTCVITRGPNPRTTHIFDDCIVESCSGVVEKAEPREDQDFPEEESSSPTVNFLSYCHTCKDNLGPGKDIYMYRGEKAFCSEECRSNEMIFGEDSDLEDA